MLSLPIEEAPEPFLLLLIPEAKKLVLSLPIQEKPEPVLLLPIPEAPETTMSPLIPEEPDPFCSFLDWKYQNHL